MKIYAAGFQHETNTFVEIPATYEAFNDLAVGPIRRGEKVNELRSLNIPLGGFLSAIKDTEHKIVPGLWAGATPSGRVTEDAYERIAGEILGGIRDAKPDAIYLDLHGAMVAEHFDDGEGELLRRIRAIVGPDVPVVASLDLHANVTQCMVDQSDGLVAYRTYPHIDMAETGRRAAELLCSRIEAGAQWKKYARRAPFPHSDQRHVHAYGAIAKLLRRAASARARSRDVAVLHTRLPGGRFSRMWPVGLRVRHGRRAVVTRR